MKIDMGLRNMGAVADRDTLTHCAVAAEEAGVDRLIWVCRYDSADHCRSELEKMQPLLDDAGQPPPGR